jgi:hypothetical protein
MKYNLYILCLFLYSQDLLTTPQVYFSAILKATVVLQMDSPDHKITGYIRAQ